MRKPKPKSLLVEPPLDGPGWKLFDAAGRLFLQHSRSFAARDMERALKSGRLHAMLRREQPLEGQLERERLFPKFWKDWVFTTLIDIGVTARARSPVIAERYRGTEFFVWEPDLKEIFSCEVAATASVTTPSTRKRNKGYDAADWEPFQVKCILILDADNTQLDTDVSIHGVATKLVKWGKKRQLRTPGLTEMRARVEIWVKRYKNALPLDD